MYFAVDLHADLIKVPLPVGVGPHGVDPFAADLSGEYRAQPVPPQPHRLVADVDASFGQNVFHIAQRQRVPTYSMTTSRITSGALSE